MLAYMLAHILAYMLAYVLAHTIACAIGNQIYARIFRNAGVRLLDAFGSVFGGSGRRGDPSWEMEHKTGERVVELG